MVARGRSDYSSRRGNRSCRRALMIWVSSSRPPAAAEASPVTGWDMAKMSVGRGVELGRHRSPGRSQTCCRLSIVDHVQVPGARRCTPHDATAAPAPIVGRHGTSQFDAFDINTTPGPSLR